MAEQIACTAVLVYPEFDTQDTFWSYARSLDMYAAPNRFGLPKRLLPPLGLMGLYAYLKPYYREIRLVDKNVDPRPLQEHITDADHVYMGGMSAQEQSLYRNALLVKECGKTLIIGGTAVSQTSPLVKVADHLVENEAEMVIGNLLQGLADGTAQHYYKGSSTPAEQFFQPDFTSIHLQDYAHMALQISRGCPESCEFCDIPARFGKNYRVTPWHKTAAAFRQLTDLGWRGPVFIVDDNFIGNPRRALEALKQLYQIGEELGIHHPKYTEMTLRFADESAIMQELRDWFRRCNFKRSFYGVETPNKASLGETGKQQNLRGSRTLQEKLAFISEQTGSAVMMGMIYGFDHDNDQTVDQFIEFVNASHAPIVMAGLLNALPQTGLMRRLKNEGRLIQQSSGNNSDGVINFIPMQLSIQQAEQNYIRILQAIYHPSAYFKRVMRHLHYFEPDLNSDFRNTSENMSSLVRILSRKHAFIYWRYLGRAVTLAGRRFKFGSVGFKGILAEYFALCAQYTHFIGQTRALQGQVSRRRYQSWQRFSWRQIQAAEITAVKTLRNHPETGLLDTLQVTLEINYDLTGTRLQILEYFSEPLLESGFVHLETARPSPAQLVALKIQSLYQVCRKRPEILGNVLFKELECHLHSQMSGNLGIVRHLRRQFRQHAAVQALQNAT